MDVKNPPGTPAPGSWIDIVAFLNSWAPGNRGVATHAPAYRLVGDVVELRGSLSVPMGGFSLSAFTLPAECCPSKAVRFPVCAYTQDEVHFRVEVLDDGNVVPKGMVGSLPEMIHLDGIRFSTL